MRRLSNMKKTELNPMIQRLLELMERDGKIPEDDI